MAEVFVSKVRPIGSSLGVLIPKEVVEAEGLMPGKEVNVSVFTPDFKALEKLFGSVKNAKPFERDRRDRV